MPAIPSRYMEASWTVLAPRSTTNPWEYIHIGFAMEFPEDNGYRTIMTCVDQFIERVALVTLC